MERAQYAKWSSLSINIKETKFKNFIFGWKPNRRDISLGDKTIVFGKRLPKYMKSFNGKKLTVF
jgi:hypothetical protein